MQDSSGSRSRRHAPNVCSHESAQVHLSSSSIRPAGTHSRAPQPPNDSVPQLLLALLRALWQATFSQVYALESFVRPLLHLPGVAISLMRATWKCLLRSWVGQIGLALATSVASLRFSYSLTRHVNSNTQEQGRPSGIAAYLGTTLSLLWGCFRLKSQVELKLARPDFAATFQRNLQCQRLQIQAEQRYQIQLEQQQRLASTASPSSGGPVYPQRLVLPDHLIPGDEVTVLCSQELTATILDFLHKQQAGELDWGPAWVESPTTAQSEDGSPRAPNNVTLNRSSRVRRTGDVSITFCSSSALRLSQPSLQGACGRSCFHTSALQNLGMPPPPSALATSRAATVYASSMTSMESVEEESRSAGPGGVEEKGVGEAPQPGGATPVKRSGSRGQRSKMWDELGSSKGTGARRAGSASLDWIGKQRCAHMEGMDAGRSENGRSVRGSLRCSNGSTQMSSKSFSAGEGIVATADNEGSAALRFAQRVAQETGAASSNGAPLPSFLLPPQLPVSTSYDSAHTSAARFAGADTCACTANGESVNGFGSSSGGYSGGGDSTGEADSLFWSSRGVFSGTAQPQDVERDEHALHQTPRMLPSPSSASSSDHEGNQAWHRGGTICHPRHGVEPRSAKGNSALSCADVAGGTGLPSISAAPELSHAGSTNGSHACSSSAAAAAAAAASKGNHPGSGRQIGGATGGTNRSRRSSAPPINLSPVPLPSPACGGSSALDQCLQSGTGGTLRAGAAETAAASAVVRAARRSNSSTPRHSTPNATAEFLPTPPLMPDGAPGLPPTPGPLVPAAHAAVGANAPSTAGGVPSPMIPARSPSQPSTDQPPTARSPAAAPQSEPHSQTSTQSSSLRMGVAVPHLYQQPAISKTVGSAQAPGDCSKGNDGKSLTPALSLPLPPTILHPADPAPGGHAGSIARPAVGGEPAGQPAAPAAGGLSARHTRRADQPQPSHHSVLTAVTGRYLGRGSPPAANLQSTTIATPQSIQVTSPAMSATNSNPPNQLTPASPVPKSSKDAQKSSSSLFSSPWSKKAHASPTAPASASAALGKGVADNHGRRKAGPASPTSPAKLPAPTDLPLSFWGLGKVFEP